MKYKEKRSVLASELFPELNCIVVEQLNNTEILDKEFERVCSGLIDDLELTISSRTSDLKRLVESTDNLKALLNKKGKFTNTIEE